MIDISVIIPLHNKELYVRETIASLQAQSFAAWEAIVIENYSSDNGPGIVAEMAASDPRIFLFHAPLDVRGPGAARNLGIEKANGEWILFLDADDWVEADYLESQFAAVRASPDSHIVVGSWVSIDSKTGAVIGRRHSIASKAPAKALEAACFGCTAWALHSAIIRTDWVRDNRMWPVELDRTISEDLAFWFRAVLGARVCWSDCDGAIYRENTPNCRNETANVSKWLRALQCAAQVNLETLKFFGLPCTPEMQESVIRAFEGSYRASLLRGDKENAKVALRHCNQWLHKYNGRNLVVLTRKIIGIQVITRISLRLRKRR